jgi:hypothetical protein
MNIRQFQSECKLCEHLQLHALQQVLAPETLAEVLQECQRQTLRTRKLNHEAIVWWLIALHFYTTLSLGGVFEKITHTLRLLCPALDQQLPVESALTYRRYQLGVRPLQGLFHRVAQPIATPKTPGAFLFGRRLVALDGHRTNLPDTKENAACFGRLHADRGDAAFPQVLGMYLSECGTHATLDAGFWPTATSEHTGARRLLRSVNQGMLLMVDRGLYSFDFVVAVRKRQAHLLARLPAGVKPKRLKQLWDGSWLVGLQPADYKRRAAGEQIVVRLIEYTLDDPTLPGYGEVYRLITTLLLPTRYAAYDLACAYHLRWEQEGSFDEMEIHQQRPDTLLRSKKPVGVLQELYALLIAHYAVRFVMAQAAEQAGLSPLGLSFVRALHLLGEAVNDFCLVAPGEYARLYARLLAEIARRPLPPRRPRCNPRVVKRKMSNFALKRPQHYQMPRLSKPFSEAIVLI